MIYPGAGRDTRTFAWLLCFGGAGIVLAGIALGLVAIGAGIVLLAALKIG